MIMIISAVIVIAGIIALASAARWQRLATPKSTTITEEDDATWHAAADPKADTTAEYFWRSTYRVTYSRNHWPFVKKEKQFLGRQLMYRTAPSN